MNFINKIKIKYEWIYSRCWDYRYLKDNLACNIETKIVFVGSSYTLFGICPAKDKMILALQSQDIYYSYKLLEKYISNNKDASIEIYLGLGYYSLYHDLSMTKSIEENNRIFDIYYPLLSDLHNISRERYEQARGRFGLTDRLMRFVIDKLVLNKRVGNYFNDSITRKLKARKTWNDSSRGWKDLSLQEKNDAADKRVKAHESLLKYDNTCEENKLVLRKLKDLCLKNNYPLLAFIAPMSEQYLKSMTNHYRCRADELKNFLNDIDINMVDYNLFDCFNSDDFVDSDHLDESGAEKLSLLLQRE